MTTDDKPAPGPAGWSCPACGLFPQVRGCTPGKCETPVEYDSEVRPRRGYISVGPDGSLTPVSFSPAVDVRQLSDAERESLMNGTWHGEEGAMDPVKNGTVLYRYSLQSADDAGEKRHPQLVILEHFPDATEMEGHAIGDCWLFKAVEREAPGYFVVVKP